jgi:hypothetical protein
VLVSEALFARNATGLAMLDQEVPKMNRVPTVMRLNDHPDRGDSCLASDPSASSSATPSRLGPGDVGILAAFACSVSACIVIWGWALGYLRF